MQVSESAVPLTASRCLLQELESMKKMHLMCLEYWGEPKREDHKVDNLAEEIDEFRGGVVLSAECKLSIVLTFNLIYK